MQSAITREYHFAEKNDYMQAMCYLKFRKLSPAGSLELLRLRQNAINSGNSHGIDSFVEKVLDTSDGMVHFADNLIIAYSPLNLLNLDQTTELENGELPIIFNELTNADKEIIAITDLEKAGINRPLTKSEALAHPGWLALVRGSRVFRKELAEAVFDYTKRNYGRDEAMAFYVPPQKQNPMMREIFLSFLGWKFEEGNYGLLSSPTRLVGYSTEFHPQAQSTLDDRFRK